MISSPATTSTAYRRYALAVLTAVYMLNLVDRGLMGLLLEPIKKDLQLSDTQLGFLTGIAFALFYAILGIPIARYADRGNRVKITTAAIGLWGLTVMSCVLVNSYAQLIFARIAAAIGEAGCKPPTYSLVGDYFPKAAERTRAMAIYWLGSPLAALLSFVVGGWLNQRLGWRMTFFVMGIPGLLLALLVKLTLSEPRSSSILPADAAAKVPSIKAVLITLWRQSSFRNLSIALVLLYTMSFGLWPWFAAFLMRSHGMGTAEVGVWLGFIIGIAGMLGILSGGYVAARWFANNEAGQMRMSAITVASLVPCFALFLLLRNKYAALSVLMPLMMAFNFFLAPTYALMQRLVVDEMRATTLSIVMLLVNLIGMGAGPQVVGILSDWLAPAFGVDSLRYAMLIVALIALWAAFHFARVQRTVAQDLSRVARPYEYADGNTNHKLLDPFLR